MREAATACATCGMQVVVLLDDANREVAIVQAPVVAYSPPRMRGGTPERLSDWEVRKVYPLHPPFCSLRRRRGGPGGSTLAPPMGREW